MSHVIIFWRENARWPARLTEQLSIDKKNSRPSGKFTLEKHFSIDKGNSRSTKKILDRQKSSRSAKKFSIDKINSQSTKKFSTSKKIVWPMKKFSRSFQIFLDLPQISLVRENYFLTNEKVFLIVKDISGPSKIYLERQNYFSANKIILDHFCPVWLFI